ncbi:MAG: hypothetical protein KIC94_15385 [Clostridiales bacterium]|nr:hypothetical protein [Clostridiales bacterium]
MENTKYIILKPQCDKLEKAVFLEKNIERYCSVAFYVEDEGECVICVSSQIGCPERCRFCATGDQSFIRNLTTNEILSELQVGISMIKDMVSDFLGKKLSVIFEGMGEASYNIDNCLAAFDELYKEVSNMFGEIILRVSSAGNIKLCEKYKAYYFSRREQYTNVTFQIKLSLHTVFDEERKYIMPNISSKYNLETILDEFGALAKIFGTKLVCNYVLFSYPNGENNYSTKYAIQLGKLIDKDTMKVTLGVYSETGKGFSSLDISKYKFFYYYLHEKSQIDTDFIELYGQDVNAACGMLNYQGI